MRFGMLGLLVACGGSEPDDNCWYCVDSGAEATVTGTDTKATTTKDTKTTTGATEKAYWYGQIDTQTVTGLGFGFTSDFCEVSYEMLEVAAATDCSECVVAASFRLGAVTVDLDAGCTDQADYEDAVLTLGHQDPTTLYRLEDGSWKSDANGYSFIDAGVWNLFPSSL